MVKNFPMNLQGEPIIGYQWDCANPEFVVCILHGIGEHAGRYDRVASFMNKEGIAVLSMDLPGHGLSAGKRGHCTPRGKILLDVDELIRAGKHLYPEIPLVLYGHSMGGNLALDYRRNGKESQTPEAYVVTSPWILLKRATPQILVRLLGKVSEILPAFPLSAGIKPNKLGNKGNYEAQPGKEMLHNVITLSTVMDAIKAAEELLQTEDHGKRLLLMHGTADYICDVEGSRTYSRIAKDCQYVEWPGYYHEIHNGNQTEDGSEVIRYMIDWIKKQV